jgi:putative CocE/NonD family hydrolase
MTLIDLGAGVTLERAVPLCLSDGTTLYSNHYYPPNRAQSPTLLMRQPYGRDIASTVVYAHPAFFARHGYNVVIQDVRGRGDSEGLFYPFRHEAQDGAETIALLRQRPESNGRIGMYGFSYQGMTQLLAASLKPEGLQCIAPAQTAHDLYHGWFYHHGALRLASSLGWGLQMLKADTRRLNLREASLRLERAWANLPAQYLVTPYGTHSAINSENVPTYVTDWFEHPEPGDFWANLDGSQTIANIQIPALHLSGWFDTYLKGSIDTFQAMSRQTENQHLIAGPWIHIPWGDRIGPTTLGDAANLDTDQILLNWFDHWLKDANTFANEPHIRHYALNEARWHTADTIPPPPPTPDHHTPRRAHSSKGNGTLTPNPPTSEEPADLYIHDPEVPVPAPGGLANAPGPTNQAALELGNNLLTYTTEPLTEPLHIFGSIKVSIHLTTSAPTADLAVKLIHLRPNNDAHFISIGIARSQHLFGPAYTPDQPHLWQFPLEPTSIVFAPGDRIRIEIASSAYPLYDRNPGTATPPHLADSWTWQRSTQILHHTPTHPSSIHLPIHKGPA